MSTSSTHLKPSSSSTPLSAKVSTASSQMFQPHPMLSTTMMPSIEAYLEAYQSLLGGGGGGTFGRDPTSALSALVGNYALRPTGGLPMSMPFIPPSYFTFPSYPMDMSPYGLMSPVLLPPFFASLYCDPSSSGAATAAATALGRASVATDYRDASAVSAKLNSALQWSASERDETKSRPVESKENSAVRSSSSSSHGLGSQVKKDVSPSVASHSAVRSTPTKDAQTRSQPLQQHYTAHNSTTKSLHSSAVPPLNGSTAGDHGPPRTSKSTLPVGSSDKTRSRPLEASNMHAASFPDQDGVPIDFSAATANRFSSAAARDAVQHPKANKSVTEASGAVPNRASVVVAPAADRDRHAARVAISTVANQCSLSHSSSSDVKSSSVYSKFTTISLSSLSAWSRRYVYIATYVICYIDWCIGGHNIVHQLKRFSTIISSDWNLSMRRRKLDKYSNDTETVKRVENRSIY